ncbi:hypothetical protein F5Y17DRAFT_412699 [Xylariaceae sp. FL0594]|nr:hypothetical protein F5Y17DRAFT_412699 [Xylariaceae sp. FL0594]
MYVLFFSSFFTQFYIPFLASFAVCIASLFYPALFLFIFLSRLFFCLEILLFYPYIFCHSRWMLMTMSRQTFTRPLTPT